LPGHGTSLDDLETKGWDDWMATADASYRDLAVAGDPVVLVGLSMGGSLACWVAAEHAATVAALVAINPFVDPPAESFRDALRQMAASGIRRAPSIGGDVADTSSREVGYDELPIGPLLSLCGGLDDLLP